MPSLFVERNRTHSACCCGRCTMWLASCVCECLRARRPLRAAAGPRRAPAPSAQRPPEANALATAATRSERTRSRELTPTPGSTVPDGNAHKHTATHGRLEQICPPLPGAKPKPCTQCAGAILGVPSGISCSGVVRRGGGEPPVTPQLARPRPRAAQPERSSRSSPLDGLQVWGFKDARRRDSSRALCGAVAKASRRAGD